MDAKIQSRIERNVGQTRNKKATPIVIGEDKMLPRIKSVSPKENYMLDVVFDDGKSVIYDVKDDMNTIKSYMLLKEEHGLFEQVQLDESRTCVFWNDEIDLPSDIIYEYGR